MIKGTYIFSQDGKEIFRQTNVITKFGKRYFTGYLAGNSVSPARDMAFGIDRSEVLVTAASASAGTVTYTGRNYFASGDIVSIYGLSTTAFNLSNVTVASATSTQFTVTNSATGTSVSNSTSGRAFRKASENDTRLGFEFYRLPVSLSSVDIQTSGTTSSYAVVYKATLPQDVAGLVSEIGIYPSIRSSVVNYDSKFLADFYDALDWKNADGYNPAYSTTNSRVGSSSLVFDSNSTSAQEYYSVVSLDLSGYSLQDTVKLAYYKNDNNLSKIKIKIYSANGSYYSYDHTPQDGSGYKISQDILISDLINSYTGTSAPDLTNIVKLGFEIYPTSGNTTSVDMDGFRINDVDTFDPIYGMLSRATLQTPLEKLVGRSVDVEYRIDIGF